MVDFEQRVEQFIEQEQLLSGVKRVLVACSGGVDSMALLTYLIRKCPAHVELFVAHVDHMLRGEQSAEDRLFVEQFCEKWSIPCFSIAIPIADILKQGGGNSQAVCRTERYQFFERTMRQQSIDTLVTAHHADDQLESLLMALTKAGTMNGMQGIQVKRPFAGGYVIRPFLMESKEELTLYLQQAKVRYREDASNEQDYYTRNRYRHHVVPLLKQENKFVSQHATQFSLQLAQDDAYLQELAQAIFDRLVTKKDGNYAELEITAFLKEPTALQRRLILILLNYLYNEANTFPSHTLCTAILKLCQTQKGSAMLYLPKAYKVSREYGKLYFRREQGKMPNTIVELTVNEWQQYLDLCYYLGHCTDLTPENPDVSDVYFSAADVAFPLRLRTRQKGDRIHLAGMQQPKRVSRLFIDEKVPLPQREQWPLLVDANDEILAVVGLRISSKLSKYPRTTDDYVFRIKKVANGHV